MTNMQIRRHIQEEEHTDTGDSPPDNTEVLYRWYKQWKGL